MDKLQGKHTVINGAFGYNKMKRKSYGTKIAIYIAVALLIFVFGLAVNKWDRANIFTILAVLMVLPGAKAVTELILFLRQTPVGEADYKKVYDVAASGLPSIRLYEKVKTDTSMLDGSLNLLADVIVTSSEKVMYLDFVMMSEKKIYVLAKKEGQDLTYIKSYLDEIMKDHHLTMDILVENNFDHYLKQVKRLVSSVSEEDYNEKAVKVLEPFIVK